MLAGHAQGLIGTVLAFHQCVQGLEEVRTRRGGHADEAVANASRSPTLVGADLPTCPPLTLHCSDGLLLATERVNGRHHASHCGSLA